MPQQSQKHNSKTKNVTAKLKTQQQSQTTKKLKTQQQTRHSKTRHQQN